MAPNGVRHSSCVQPKLHAPKGPNVNSHERKGLLKKSIWGTGVQGLTRQRRLTTKPRVAAPTGRYPGCECRGRGQPCRGCAIYGTCVSWYRTDPNPTRVALCATALGVDGEDRPDFFPRRLRITHKSRIRLADGPVRDHNIGKPRTSSPGERDVTVISGVPSGTTQGAARRVSSLTGLNSRSWISVPSAEALG